jgi:hypothetical protein|tara:strand:- start:232 stop:468 length:237 start_codon:yes stop_codon:yes gene_type:complete
MRANDLPAIESYAVDDDGGVVKYRIVYGDSYGEAGGFETREDAAVVLKKWIEIKLYDLARHTVQLHKISKGLKKWRVT